MASDLPDAGHASATAMARSLVTYMDCPRRIQRAIKGEFDHPPALHTIENMRSAWLASNEPEPYSPVCLNEGAYYPADAANDLEETNKQFLWRLDLERLASQRRVEVA